MARRPFLLPLRCPGGATLGASGIAARITLTERFIASPARVPESGRVEFLDALVPGLALRVGASGHRAFVLIARYPAHPQNPTRRTLGRYGALTLDHAREKAREWLALIAKGTDPGAEAERERVERERRQVNSFARVAGEFLDRHAATLAHAKPARRIIEQEFVQRWGTRPITDVAPEEVAAAIRAIVQRGSPYQAHNALGHLRRMYSWAIGTHEFGVKSSPCADLRPKDLIGRKEARQRILTDAELRAVWDVTSGKIDASALADARKRAADREKLTHIGYPYGPLIRLLILTGQREREVAGMRWREVDIANKLWTIPPERMKGRRAHEVPLSSDTLALIESMPRFNAGDHVFTTTGGAKPVNGFSRTKERLDELSGVAGWKIHDLRRTARTHFSALPIPDMVRELVIAHAQPGLHQVYDQHSYREEKRECLKLWEARLRGIIARPLT